MGDTAEADLTHHERTTQRGARYLEQHLGPDTRAAGALADEATEALTGGEGLLGGAPWAPGRRGPATFSPLGGTGMSGWEVRAGLGHRHAAWQRHSTQLLARLHGELNGLLDTNQLLGGQDDDTAATLRALDPSTRTSALDIL